MSLSPKLEATLKAIHAGIVANGVHYANPQNPMVSALVSSGLVMSDNTRIDPNDGRRVSIVVTDAGHTALGIQPAAVVTETPTHTQEIATMEAEVLTADKPKRTRTTVVPEVRMSTMHMPLPAAAARRGGNRTETYAFGKLEAPRPDGSMHSFFVPSTAENPTPANTIRAAVSSANARYKDKGGAVFKHHEFDNDPEFGVAGVRVFRVK